MTTAVTTTHDIAGVLDDLRAWTDLLDSHIAHWIDDAPELESVDVLDRVRALRVQLAQIEATVERHTASVMVGDQLEFPGGVAVRRFGNTRKAWKHDELVAKVVAQIVDDLSTVPDENGEVVHDDELAATARSAVEQYSGLARPEWRVTALREFGIDADEFCESIPGRASVQITRADA